MIATPSATLEAFVLPPENEAGEPPERRGIPRDRVRMLVSDRRTGELTHARFDALPALLAPGDLLVVNDSATLPAALQARRSNGSQLLLHVSSRVAQTLWIVEPRAFVSVGETLQLPGDTTALMLTTVAALSRRLWYARVDAPVPYAEYLHAYGAPIRYRYVQRAYPLSDYQTVFARVPGSAEMPSAGRPFSPRVIAALEARGVELRTITLHCGVASAEAHEPPQPERFVVPAATARAVNAARAEKRRVIAVGTTVVRALESAAHDGGVVAQDGLTERVITPDAPPRIVDGLLTGLHEPRASHLAMLASLLDARALANAYAAAVEAGYRWHEFGDVHLILPA